MVAIERDNQRLKGVLPKDYARPGLDKHRLGELIDLIGTISLVDSSTSPLEGERAGVRGRSHRSKDILAASTNTSSASSPAPRARRRPVLHAAERRPPFFLTRTVARAVPGSASKWELHCHCRSSSGRLRTRSSIYRNLLNIASGGVVFTTIQKFMPEEKGGKAPLLSERRNIVVIADEAHRSQYDLIDGLARNLRDSLPHAPFIGFTGTPIEKTDANTRASSAITSASTTSSAPWPTRRRCRSITRAGSRSWG